MQADFTQTVYDNHGKASPNILLDKWRLQRPGKFRWEVTKPIATVHYCECDTKLWIYDPDLEQVTIRSLKASRGSACVIIESCEY